MFKKIIFAGASVLTCAIAVPAANAGTLVNFDDLVPNIDFSASSVTDNGYVFTGSSEGFSYIWSGDSPNSNGTNNLILGYSPDDAITITQVGGGAFTLDSFDTSISWYSTDTAASILVNGSPLAITDVDANYTVNLTGTAVTLTGLPDDSGYWQADNFVFNAAVPEPATWMMALTGFGLIGFAMRRRPSVRVNFAYA